MRFLVLALLMAVPANAQEDDLFAVGTVFCSNHDPLTQTCKTITTVTQQQGSIRYSRSLRRIALPDSQVLMETQGFGRVEGSKTCALGSTAPPSVTPPDNEYVPALLTVYVSKRDSLIAKGVCAEYRPCGSGYRVYRTHDGLHEPKLIAFATIFRAGDPRIASLTPRDRVFGVPEPIKPECEPLS